MFLTARRNGRAVTEFSGARWSGSSAATGVTKGRSMSTFDDPFDAERALSRAGCVCGQHRSAAEHEHATLALRCEPVESEEKRYERVVASALARAIFPKDPPLRALPKAGSS